MSVTASPTAQAQRCNCCRRPIASCVWRMTQRPEYQRVARAEATQSPSHEFVHEKLLKLGVPPYLLRGLVAPHETPALQGAREFLGNRQALFLALLGEFGLGKSTAAVFVMQDAVRRFPWNAQPSGSGVASEPCRFIGAASLTGLSAFDADDSAFFDTCARVPLLVVDDMGEEGTEFGKNKLLELLTTRHAYLRRTVFTTNLAPDKFVARYGQKLLDRVRESGVQRGLRGPSLRKPMVGP